MRLSAFISSVACLFALCASVAADTITLKTSARLRAAAQTIALSDIAVLEGEEAIRLADTAIAQVKTGAGPVDVSVAEVRKALDAAGANWARVNLSGRSVLVRPARDPGAAAPQAMTPASIAAKSVSDKSTVSGDVPAQDATTLDQFVGEQTIRGSIAALIATNLRIDPRDARVRFDARDLPLLHTALDAGRFEIQPLGALSGDRLEFAVRGWEGANTKNLGQVTLFIERRMNVTRPRTDLPRDRAMVDDDLETTEIWLTPSEAISVAPHPSIVGRTLSRSLHAGDIVRIRDLQQETLIKRGDLVTVRCLVGGVAISLQAEARADGAQGDAIECRKTGERETFLATVTGRNQAVVDLARR